MTDSGPVEQPAAPSRSATAASKFESRWGLLPVALLTLVGGLALCAAGWIWSSDSTTDSLVLACLGVVAVAVAGLLQNQRLRTLTVASGLDGWTEAEHRAADLEAVRREQAKLRMALDGLSARLVAEARGLETREQGLHKSLAELDEVLVEARQARGEARELATRWDDFAVSLLSVLHRSRDLEGVRAVYGDVVDRLQGHGMDVIDPAVSAMVDERHHRVVATEQSPDVETGGVIRVVSPGVRRGGEIVQPAEVVQAIRPPEVIEEAQATQIDLPEGQLADEASVGEPPKIAEPVDASPEPLAEGV